jgi:hypothetical protein
MLWFAATAREAAVAAWEDEKDKEKDDHQQAKRSSHAYEIRHGEISTHSRLEVDSVRAVSSRNIMHGLDRGGRNPSRRHINTTAC